MKVVHQVGPVLLLLFQDTSKSIFCFMNTSKAQTESQHRLGDVNKLDLYYAKINPLPCGIMA